MGREPSRLGLVDRAAAEARAARAARELPAPGTAPRAPRRRLPIARSRWSRSAARWPRARASCSWTSRRAACSAPTSIISSLSSAGSATRARHRLHQPLPRRDSRDCRRFTVLRDGRSVAAGALRAPPNDELVAQMVGRSVDHLFPHAQPPRAGETVLAVEIWRRPPCARRASTLRRGEVLGIAGLMGRAAPNWSAPSSASSPVSGYVRAADGRCPAATRSAPRAARGRTRLSERGPERRGPRAVDVARGQHHDDAVRGMRHAAAGWLADQRARRRTGSRRSASSARPATQAVRTLSGGNQQKVALARLMHQQADVLLLDEPTRGIDIGSKAQIYDAVVRAADAGKAVLMVSSYLPELFGLCDRLAVMSRGRLSRRAPDRRVDAGVGAARRDRRGRSGLSA